MKKRIYSKFFIVSIGVIVLTAIGIGVWFSFFNKDLNSVDYIEQAVGRHYILPEEKPALATVEDRSKLSSDFLQAAENGDKLLIYKDAKKVILYRPSIDRIVEVGPISIAPTVTARQ